MNKGMKITLNILVAIGIGSGGYFIGYKVATKKASEWASNEINAVINSYEQKELEREDIIAEKLVKPEDLAPEILEQMEYGKADEVIIEENDILFDEPVEVIKEEPKPKKKSKRKSPYFISSEEFDKADYEQTMELEVDENGDLYVDQSDDIYEDWTKLGTTMINKMVHEHKIDGINEWFVKDDQTDTFYSITYRK